MRGSVNEIGRGRQLQRSMVDADACAKLREQSATATDGDLCQEADIMERSEFLAATRQLAAAAEILAKAGPPALQFDAFQMLAFFRRYDQPGAGMNAVATSNDALFASTGHAALTMAGRNEFAASHALLEQARLLLAAT